jgi:hypothetical protein
MFGRNRTGALASSAAGSAAKDETDTAAKAAARTKQKAEIFILVFPITKGLKVKAL